MSMLQGILLYYEMFVKASEQICAKIVRSLNLKSQEVSMGNSAIADLYYRFVSAEKMNQKLIIVDDSDPGVDTTDHLDSPLMCEAMKETWPHNILAGRVIKVPFSAIGPTLIIYWRCSEPKITSLEDGFEVEIPYGRLATIFRGDDGEFVFNAYYAWGC